MDKNRVAVDNLLAMYTSYKTMSAREAQVSRVLAKAKALRRPDKSAQAEYNQVKKELQRLADAMTFANPIIWLLYKFEAYKDEAQPIRTMHELRLHCSKPGYICTKRYVFLNEWLKKQGSAPLSDGVAYPDDVPVDTVVNSSQLRQLADDAPFSERWRQYEYHTIDGRVAKWENYGL